MKYADHKMLVYDIIIIIIKRLVEYYSSFAKLEIQFNFSYIEPNHNKVLELFIKLL